MYSWVHRQANVSKSQTQATLKDDKTERGSAILRLDVGSHVKIVKQEKTDNMTDCTGNVFDRSKPRSQRQANEMRGSSNGIIHILEGLREIENNE